MYYNDKWERKAASVIIASICFYMILQLLRFWIEFGAVLGIIGLLWVVIAMAFFAVVLIGAIAAFMDKR